MSYTCSLRKKHCGKKKNHRRLASKRGTMHTNVGIGMICLRKYANPSNEMFQVKTSISFLLLLLIDCSQIHCGKSLKAKNCNNCVRVQMHRTAKCHVYAKKNVRKKNAAITWCGAQSFVCVCVYVHVLACAMHFKEFLMTVKKWKGPAVKYKDRYRGGEKCFYWQ